MQPVAVLFASRVSIYHELADELNLEVYDEPRDARTFTGGMPIVAHPPCRSWSAYTAHQSKPQPGERQLALWCVEQLRKYGGVLEQPAHSRLFEASNIPRPSDNAKDNEWSAQVWQSWWGFEIRKRTWLAFFHVSQSAVEFPFALWDQYPDRKIWNKKSTNNRARTCEAMARWLVDAARNSTAIMEATR